MPGTITFKPIEANLTHNTDLIGKMNPYCAYFIGNQMIKGQVCKKGGKHPHWNDSVSIPVSSDSSVMIELMDKDKFTRDDSIGNVVIDLREIETRGHVSKWYPLTYKNRPAGEILLESTFESTASSVNQNYQGEQLGMGYQGEQIGMAYQGEQIAMSQPTAYQQETFTSQGNLGTQSNFVQEEVISSQIPVTQPEGKIFMEQRQVVEPHTFTKNVDVVETRPVVKEVEVLEPVKVVKDVQYTAAVPVKKEIEVVEPQVVKKEVEVIEPRLVTKQIQVVENVPVMKEVDVIEPRTIVKEVETMEPQTFTKQVEVTEQVPVKKQVQTTEPITVTKAVDFVEPVITTKTVTKEIQQPIVVDEKITTTVGPATVVGVETEIRQQAFVDSDIRQQAYVDRARDVKITEEERLLNQQAGGYQYSSNTSNTSNTYATDELGRKKVSEYELTHNQGYQKF